ncbi:MAG: transposase [Spirochaetes bacterium]|nr:transposase [Spirochaetota bacterium]
MERKRFTEQQIHDILKESEAGANSLELCRKYGISKNTVWRKTRNAWSLSLNLFSKCSNYLRRDNKKFLPSWRFINYLCSFSYCYIIELYQVIKYFVS